MKAPPRNRVSPFPVNKGVSYLTNDQPDISQYSYGNDVTGTLMYPTATTVLFSCFTNVQRIAHKVNYILDWGCTNAGPQVARETVFYAVMSNICGFSVTTCFMAPFWHPEF
jgi:hypothetical protein